MKDTQLHSEELIESAYRFYYPQVRSYISIRIPHKYDAEDLTQDVFERLLNYKQMLRPSTIKYFIYTIARNIITDHLRRYYKKQEIDEYYHQATSIVSNETVDTIIANDLRQKEYYKALTLSPKRKTIYIMSRYKEQSVPEIAKEMQLSCKTVENHLLAGRHLVRKYMKAII